MKSFFILLFCLLGFTQFGISQDTTLITVIKKGEKPKNSESAQGKPEIKTQQFLNSLPWWRWNPSGGSAGQLGFIANTEIYAAAEFDLSKNETAHYYNLGADLGTDAFLVGAGVKLPNHSPVGSKQRTLFSVKAYKKFSFKAYSSKTLSLYKAPRANFQCGTEFNFGSVNSTNSEQEKTKEKFRYFTPFIGLFHPVFQKSFIGVRLLANFIKKPNQSYSSIALQYTYNLE